MPYLNECPHIDRFDVIEVKRTKTGKGFLFIGSDCTCFIWNSNKLLKHILVALASWVDTNTGFLIEVVRVGQTEEVTIELVMRKKQKVEVQWVPTESGYILSDFVMPTEDTNPFL